MDADWIKSPMARRVLVHWADARPAWLWSQDGENLLWRNEAARFFHGKIKKHGIRLAPEAVPIKGQIARLIRLGSPGRSSLSRIQFLAGERPISTTCTATPLELPDGSQALLIVGVDPIQPELLATHDASYVDALAASLLPPGAEYLAISDDSQIASGTPLALERYAPIIESEGLPWLPDSGTGPVELAGDQLTMTRFKASPHDAMLLLFENAARRVREPTGAVADGGDVVPAPEIPAAEIEAEPLLPIGLPEIEAPEVAAETNHEDVWVAPVPEHPGPAGGGLSSLFDRLAGDDGLFAPLTAADDYFAGPPAKVPETVFVEPAPLAAVQEPAAEMDDVKGEEGIDPAIEPAPSNGQVTFEAEPETPEPLPDADSEAIGRLIAFADDSEDADDEASQEPMEPAPNVWRVTGRGFVPLPVELPGEREAPLDEAPVETASVAPDAETVERVSRYNFDELSRILTDRVGNPVAPAPADPAAAAAAAIGPVKQGELVNLSGETFILNRLPLGILVFRDQQVLFANRALTELTGYDSIEALRAAGLTSIFPAEGADAAGPVTQLVKRDGTLAPVNARLLSITWHGKPALMLSAGVADSRIGHEAAVKAYAALAADTAEDGFFAADRAGIITQVSLHGRIVLGQTEESLVGRPLAALVDAAQLTELKQFLERPARLAETARPALTMAGAEPGLGLTIFAEGQAGIVAGYFGTIRRLAGPARSVRPAELPHQADDLEPSMLSRISRGVRRPLNSIIGFAEMIGSPGGGPLAEARHTEYARDIRSAGQEIAALIDELDNYSRLRDGRYPAQADDIDLGTLLEACLLRVRGQAGAARVLVRSAISERLPRITVDSASLTQAILNLLASAIDQTPIGGSVILSAQLEDDGAIVINVRDSGNARTDLGERFMVFRDGTGKDGEALVPVRSSVGLALTRSLLAVNALSLSVDPTAGAGTLFSLVVPASMVGR